MKIVGISGAIFDFIAPDSWERFSCVVSEDGSRLAWVYRAPDGFRVQRFVRSDGAPELRGEEWWLKYLSASIADSQSHAEDLAAEFVGGTAI